VSRPCFLGIETSGVTTGVALGDADVVLFEESLGSGASHDELLLPLLDKALKATGTRLAGLAGIGVTIGPGMFSALRVGLSVAKGLAVAHDLPVKGINALWALAQAAGSSGRPVLAVVDARKSQVYAAMYRDAEPLIEPAVLAPSELADRVRQRVAGPLVVAGNAAALCADALRHAGVDLVASGIAAPPPRVIAQAAARALATGPGDDIETLEPLYLRRTDAELNRERRA
jgi:tRNA threonylcarbamoyladenosine biosynthesis protein TsaB